MSSPNKKTVIEESDRDLPTTLKKSGSIRVSREALSSSLGLGNYA